MVGLYTSTRNWVDYLGEKDLWPSSDEAETPSEPGSTESSSSLTCSPFPRLHASSPPSTPTSTNSSDHDWDTESDIIMSSPFLDLPREIRDQIYSYILYPTSFIEPQICPYTASPTPKPQQAFLHQKPVSATTRFRLCTNPLPLPRRRGRRRIDNVFPPKGPTNPQYTSLSIRRTCKQIHAETENLFWHHNTIYFSPTLFTLLPKFLKSITQPTSRLIRSVRLQMPFLSPFYNNSFPKILHLLASRARYGRFERLELVWGEREWIQLLGINDANVVDFDDEGTARAYDRMLVSLYKGASSESFERVVRVPSRGLVKINKRRKTPDEEPDDIRVAREIHCAFGGSLYMGDRLVFKDYLVVGNDIALKPTRPTFDLADV